MTKPFSVAFKQKMVQRLTGKNAVSASQLAREMGVRQQIQLLPDAPRFHASTNPPSTIATMPSATRRSKFSRKTNHASSAVNMSSRFNSKMQWTHR